MKDSLRVLKIRLLLRALDQVPNSEWHSLVIQEVQAACAQAEGTQFPELLLPCLLQERVDLAIASAERREKGYWGRLALDQPALTRRSMLVL